MLVFSVLVTAGCSEQTTRLTLTSYLEADQPKEYAQSFQRGWFCENSSGEFLIALENEQYMAEPAERWVRQYVFITLLWVPKPGTTFAESSQINARIEYVMLSSERPDGDQVSRRPLVQLCYRGTGFVSFRKSRRGDRLTGRIESSLLQPPPGQVNDLFGEFTLVGRFRAVRDAGQVGRIRSRAGRFCRD